MSDNRKMTIETTQELKRMYIELLADDQPVDIDFSAIAEIDISGIQLLVSLARSAKESNKVVRFTGNVPPDIQDRLLLAGIGDELCDTGERFESALLKCME